jgi:class 3 adenylate cyclase
LQALREPNPAPAAIAEGCDQLSLALAALAPYIPAPALELQLAAPTETGGRGLPMHGSLLFAELSGFTTLASQLATMGRRGGEEVGAIITRLFGALVAEIDLRGGWLLKFGGNTLTAFFHSAPLGTNHAALGSAAALALQERMNDFVAIPTSKGAFQLRLRIGVHSGTVMAVEVGDQSHMELVVNGPATNQVVLAQESAAPGEVIITRATRELLGDARTELKTSGMYLLDRLVDEPRTILPTALRWQPGQPGAASLTALLERLRTLRSYLPNGLPGRFLRSDTTIGEFRPVTVMFVNFDAFTKLLALIELPALLESDLAIIGTVLNTYYRHLQTIVHRYGGSISKIDMATFGNRLMVLFGAPSAHEDDPYRAVRAALDIRANWKEINREIAELLRRWTERHPDQRALLRVANVSLRQRIGIASGPVFAGLIGTPQRREYTVMGETVQVAARTLAAAEAGEILLASLTQRAVRQIVKTEPLLPVKLRNAARAIPIFRVLGLRDSPDQTTDVLTPVSPLIGRAAELGQLLDLAQGALTSGSAACRSGRCGEW